MNLKQYIHNYKDFPTEGIIFRDIFPLLRNPQAWTTVLKYFKKQCEETNPTLIAGIESRGFLLGAVVSSITNIGFIPIRKKGKLPGDVTTLKYELEYGTSELEIQSDILNNNERVLILDDLLATGGTASAALKLVEKADAKVIGLGFIIELTELNGREKFSEKIEIRSLLTY